MLNEIIFPALIRLVRAFPPGLNSRPNSFRVLSSYKDFDSANLNATAVDGREGRYWGRRWEAGGKSSENIQYENSLIFMRPETIALSKVARRAGEKVCRRFEIGIASLPECEGCAHARSDTEIETDNVIVLNEVVSEITQIKPFNVTIPVNLGGIGASTYWITPGEKAWLITNGVAFPTFNSCPAYLSVRKTTDDFTTEYYGTAGMLITTTKVVICWCEATVVAFNFGLNSFKQAAYTGCEAC